MSDNEKNYNEDIIDEFFVRIYDLPYVEMMEIAARLSNHFENNSPHHDIDSNDIAEALSTITRNGLTGV